MWQLLNIAFDARLRLVFHKHASATQHVGVQLGFARTIAANAVDMHAGLNHVGRQNGGVRLVRRNSGDDIRAANRVCNGLPANDF